MRRLSIALSCVGMLGCGLDESGIVGPGGGADVGVDAALESGIDVGAPEVTADVVPDTAPQPCSAPPGPCVASLPAGWELVAFGAGTSGCPSNYAAQNVVSNPQAQAGACDCQCTVGAAPVCDVGALQRYVSSDSSCGSPGVVLSVNGPGCTPWTGGSASLSSHSKATPLAPSGGTCTGDPVVDTSKVTTTQGRACLPPTQCQEQLCGGDVPAGFGLCVAMAGAQASCPAGWGSPVVVGDAVDLACSACSCDVNGPSSCGSASLSIFSNSNCTTSLVTMPIDGTCANDTAAGQYAVAFEYHATLTEVCTATGPKTPTPSLHNARTICCKP